MFYKAWIQLVNETFLFLGTCGAVNLYYLCFNTFGNAINSLLSAAVLLLIFVFPMILARLYLSKTNYDMILSQDQEFIAKYGAILDNLNFKSEGKKVFVYVFCGFIRKLLLICITVFM